MRRIVGLTVALLLVLASFGAPAFAGHHHGGNEKLPSADVSLIVKVGKWAELNVGDEALEIELKEPGAFSTKTTPVRVMTNSDVKVTLAAPHALEAEGLSWEENDENGPLYWYLSFINPGEEPQVQSDKWFTLTAGTTVIKDLCFAAKWNPGDNWWQLKATETGYMGTATVTVAAQ